MVDGLDLDDTWWGLEFLDARNPKKLDQMRKDIKTPMYSGSSMTKLEADLSVCMLASNN